MKKIMILLMITALVLSFPRAAYAASVTASSGSQISIVSFDVEENKDGTFEVSWTLAKTYGVTYVSVYQVTDTNSQTGRLLTRTQTSARGSAAPDMSDADPGYCRFMLAAESGNGTTAYEITEEAFFITNENRAEELSGVIASRDADQVFLTWDGDVEATVFLYDDDTKELLFSKTVSSKPCSIDIPAGHENVCAGAAAAEDGIYGNFTPISLSTDNTPLISVYFASSDVTNDREYTFQIASASSYTIRVYRDREECAEVREGSGTYTVSLLEGVNEIALFVSDNKGRTSYAQWEVVLDTKEPSLELTDTPMELRTTGDVIYIKGTTEEGAIVICDNEEIDLVGEAFSIKKELAYGQNTINLLAVDDAGNENALTISVARSFWSKDHITAAVYIALGILLAAAEVVWLILKKKWRKNG